MLSKKAQRDAAYHSFDAGIAQMVSSIPAAVVYRNIVFWVRHNETNGKNFHEGRYWTYNSLKAFGEQFPYLTLKQIRTALDRLLNAGLIVKGNHAEDRFKRDNWYALGGTSCPDGQMNEPKRADVTVASEGNTSAPEGKSLNNKYKPNLKPNLTSVSGEDDSKSGFNAIWNAYPEDRRRDRAACRQLVAEALKELSLEDLTAATKAYAAESSGFQRFTVSFIDNWLRDRKWLRHVEDVRQKRLDVEATAIKQSAKIAAWIKSRDPMCKHLTKLQVLDALERALIRLPEAQAAGFLQ